MNRLIAIAVAFAAFVPSASEAQRVSGLEMSIEGSLTAVEGREELLLVTLHAVSGADELRPAPNAELKVTASYRADGPIANLRTDRHGRAEIRYTPEDSGSLEIVIDAFHGGASRRFRVPIQIATQATLQLEVLPTRAEPGAPVLVFGHATDPAGMAVGAGREIRLIAPGREPVVVGTTTDGAFVAQVRAPDEEGRASIRATLEPVQGSESERYQPGASGQVELAVAEPAMHRGLRARGVPRQRIVRPRSPIVVDVEVRDGLGRPVRASVSRQGSNDEAVRADEHGIATFEWTAPSITGVHDHVATFRVQLPGEAPIDERVTVRVASVLAAADVAPEAGALIPGVPSRLLVKAVGADGAPYSGPVTLTAPRFGTTTLTTDERGHGVTEVTLSEEATTDACGGVTALAVSVAFGDAEGEARCVPIDPDAAVRARVAASGGELRVDLHRRAAVRRAPAVVTVFRMLGDSLVPVSSRWVDGDEVTIERPAPGPLWVRARLRVGRNEAEVRGSFAFAPGPDAPEVHIERGAARSPETSAVGSLLSSAASIEAYERRRAGPDPLAIARSVPRDIGAPFRLVRGEPTPAAPLDEPVKLAVLRDPWRQRALYRSGRLALLFRTLENQVAEATDQERSSLDGFTHEVRGRRQFNEGFLESIDRTGELGPEGARDLGGEPLSLERLRGMDRAFGFDTVARRVTRKRLIELLAVWRPWVHDRDLDPAFAPHADPRHWWATFCDEHGWTFDGWGRPVRLRPSRRGRRDGAPVVVPGWSITSAGPDGRFDTNDDLSDPFASVVPAGLYADAVGEEGLVQALRRGVLDRETIRLLDAGPMARIEGQSIRGGLPQPLTVEPPPFLSSELRVETRLGSDPLDTRLPPATVPHRVLAIAVGGPRGVGVASEPVSSRAGARIAVPIPARLHGGVPLAMPVVVVAGERTEGLTLSVTAEGASVSVGSAELGSLDEGDAVERTLRVEATGASPSASVTLALERGGETLVERRLRAPVVDGTPERTLWAGSAIDGVWRVRYPIPEDARDPATRLVVVAPGRVDADPRLAFGPIARAWAKLMAGEGDAVHLEDLPPEPTDAVDAARLALLTTALGEDRRQHRGAERQLSRALRGLDAAGKSRLLAVLSSMALPRFANASGNGPAAVAQRLRVQLWGIHETEGAPLARMAAALLLTDPEDPNGRAAFVRARRTMEPAGDSDDAQVVPATDPRDQLAGSVALALAAHVAGDTRTRDRLVRGLGRRTHLAADRQSDAAFWLLTASAHGAFGRSEGEATLRIGDGSEPLAFEDGVAIARVDGAAEIALELETSGGVHLSRLETRYGRPVVASDESPLRVAIEGIDGRAGRRAGYEIRVSATTAVEHPVLAITLPPGADLEPSALAAIGATEGVSAMAPPDARGVVRIELGALAAEQERRFPLPLRWAGAGEREGLAIAAWERARPWQVTSIPARAIDVRP